MNHRSWLLAAASAISAHGLGLLVWLGISLALLQGRGMVLAELRPMQQTALVVACVLALPGVISLLALANGKWRRLGLVALALALASAVAVAMLLSRQQPDPGSIFLAAALLGMGAVCAVLCAGMATAADGRDSWRSQMVAPNFLAFALLAAAALLFALIALKGGDQELLSTPTPSLVMLIVVVAALKLLYWFENGGLRAPAATSEDAPRLRLATLALLAVIPLLLVGVQVLWPQLAPRAGWCLIVLSILGGGCLERYLLAAEAGRMARGARPA